MTRPILIATDLDRTLLPNGNHPESPGVREIFARIVAKPEVHLAYVSGRNLEQIKEAVAQYLIPWPDYAITDVGSAIWTSNQGQWQRLAAWDEKIAPAWNGHKGSELATLVDEMEGMTLQEEAHQGRFKLSYYTSAQGLPPGLLNRVRDRLRPAGIRAHLVYSVDEISGQGFLDILPEGASKRGAVEFLVAQGQFSPDRLLFSGDSGNDMDCLTSPLPAVLVANATESVRKQAVATCEENGSLERLYLARGRYGMNGCYAAGILEGLAHFLPEVEPWLKERNP